MNGALWNELDRQLAATCCVVQTKMLPHYEVMEQKGSNQPQGPGLLFDLRTLSGLRACAGAHFRCRLSTLSWDPQDLVHRNPAGPEEVSGLLRPESHFRPT